MPLAKRLGLESTEEPPLAVVCVSPPLENLQLFDGLTGDI
jgi:hypothetical protein